MNPNDLKKRLKEELKTIKNNEKEFPNLQEKIKTYNLGWKNCLNHVIGLLDETAKNL